MSQVSKHQLSSKIYTKIFSLFPQFLSRMTSRGKLDLFVNEFFAPTEKIVIAKRVAIAFMLTKGYTYEIICNKLKVSHGTVAKVATFLKSDDQTINKELEAIAKEEAFINFIDAIGFKLTSALPPKGGNWSAWKARVEKERRDQEEIL